MFEGGDHRDPTGRNPLSLPPREPDPVPAFRTPHVHVGQRVRVPFAPTAPGIVRTYRNNGDLRSRFAGTDSAEPVSALPVEAIWQLSLPCLESKPGAPQPELAIGVQCSWPSLQCGEGTNPWKRRRSGPFALVVFLEQSPKGSLGLAQTGFGQQYRLRLAHRVRDQSLLMQSIHRVPVKGLPRARGYRTAIINSQVEQRQYRFVDLVLSHADRIARSRERVSGPGSPRRIGTSYFAVRDAAPRADDCQRQARTDRIARPQCVAAHGPVLQGVATWGPHYFGK